MREVKKGTIQESAKKKKKNSIFVLRLLRSSDFFSPNVSASWNPPLCHVGREKRKEKKRYRGFAFTLIYPLLPFPKRDEPLFDVRPLGALYSSFFKKLLFFFFFFFA